jgi:2-C-methyl-D-erythritol 4-phosphate cytidylyltransferase
MFKPPEYALIVAGGSGTRMQQALPKQFLSIGKLPVLMHTLLRFYQYNPAITIVLVLPEAHFAFWKKLCEEHQFTLPHRLVAGGTSRFASVKNGLREIPEEALVAVHDGVRPFVALDTIAESFRVAAAQGSAIASVALKDSIRWAKNTENKALDRQDYRLIQTPQTFRASLLKRAYQQEEQSLFTDDASVVEALGEAICLIEGSYRNIKITTPEDLLVAEAFLQAAST